MAEAAVYLRSRKMDINEFCGYLRKRLGIELNQQRDVADFLNIFLDLLKRETPQLGLINACLLVSEVEKKCECGEDTKTEPASCSFFLEVRGTESLQNYLNSGFKIPLKTFKSTCQKCTSGSISRTYSNLPELLFIKVAWETDTFRTEKWPLEKAIEFPDKNKQRQSYFLFAVIIHNGNTNRYGHYFTCVKVGGGWRLISDASVYSLATLADLPDECRPILLLYVRYSMRDFYTEQIDSINTEIARLNQQRSMLEQQKAMLQRGIK